MQAVSGRFCRVPAPSCGLTAENFCLFTVRISESFSGTEGVPADQLLDCGCVLADHSCSTEILCGFENSSCDLLNRFRIVYVDSGKVT